MKRVRRYVLMRLLLLYVDVCSRLGKKSQDFIKGDGGFLLTDT